MTAPGPGRIVQTRIAAIAEGLAEAAVDASKDAWVRCSAGNGWTPWRQISSGMIDIDIAPASSGTAAALVVVTPAIPGAGRRVFALASDGSVTATSL